MLRLITITSLAFLGVARADISGQIATVVCELDAQQSPEVAELRLRSVRKFKDVTAPTKGGLEILYREGEQESLQPVEKTDLFGKPSFSAEVPFKRGRVFFPESKVGDIYVDFECYHSPGVPWERCQSQGSGEHGKFSRVNLRLGDRTVGFTGDNLCRRSVENF